MQIIKRIFKKPAPKVLSFDEKLLELKSKDLSVFESVAKGENSDYIEEAFRTYSIEQIPDSSSLCDLAASPGQPAYVSKKAKERLATMLDNKEVSLDKIQTKLTDIEQQLSVVTLCQTNDLENRVLKDVTSQDLLGKLCESARSSSIRSTLVEKIDDADVLKGLLSPLKTKDKKAYRIVKSKLDVIKIRERQEAERQQAVTNVCEETERQVTRHVDAQYKLDLDRLKRRWDEVKDDASSESSQKYVSAMTQCERALNEYQEKIQKAEQEQFLIDHAQEKQTEMVVGLELKLLEYSNVETFDPNIANSVSNFVDEQKNAWTELRKVRSPKMSVEKRFYQYIEKIEMLSDIYAGSGTLKENLRLVKKLQGLPQNSSSVANVTDSLDSVSKPSVLETDSSEAFGSTQEGNESPAPVLDDVLEKLSVVVAHFSHIEIDNDANGELLEACRAILVDYRQLKHSKETELKKQISTIQNLIRKSNGAVDQGRLKQALGIRHSIDEKADHFKLTLPDYLQKKLTTLDENIQKLIDWQAYAVVPKKEALVESMSKLVGADLSPEVLSVKVKKLQDEWRELKQSGGDSNEDLWLAFRSKAEEAYEPCKAYFDDLSKVRKENLEKRRSLVKQLQDFETQYDWDNADWKTVEKVLRTARKELHEYVPVDRADNKVLLVEFDASMDRIQERLNAERNKNKAAKELLVQQAEKLQGMEDLSQAIDSAKRLQSQWKVIGACHYRDNESLWKSFRAACDVVFERKSEVDAEQRGEIDKVIAQANSYIAQIRDLDQKAKMLLIDSPDSELSEGSILKEKSNLAEQFKSLENLPERVKNAVERDFSKSMSTLDDTLVQVKSKKTKDKLVAVHECLRLFNTYQFQRASSIDSNEALESLNTAMSSIQTWPDKIFPVLKKSITEDVTKTDLNHATDEKRMLCIRAEVTTGKESPVSDKNFRMEYQVNMLQKGITAASVSNTRQILIKEWIESAPIDVETYEVLFERFLSSWQTL